MMILNACEGLFLIGHPVLGVVWRLDVKTGEYAQVIDLPIMKSIPGSIPTLGVNGIKYRDGHLYFTSRNQQIFAQIPINPDGTAAGEPVITSSETGSMDDFDLDSAGNSV